LFTHLTKTTDEKYEFVINTCGYTGRPNVDACEDNIEDTWYYNVIVPVNIQKACKDAGVRMIHISSGCIYNGYDKFYTETDEPDFGLLEPKSSWYSKTKHACEMMLKGRCVYIMRIRMPFCETWSERSVLTKLIKYDNVINCLNSLTNLEDLCGFITYFIEDIIDSDRPTYEYGIYNVVNPEPIETAELLSLIDEFGLGNPNWKHIELEELYKKTKTQRSNCVLSDDKISKLKLKLPKTRDSLRRCLKNMKDEFVSANKT
jgi:dTDP-4-dehydrorhamnose reductase